MTRFIAPALFVALVTTLGCTGSLDPSAGSTAEGSGGSTAAAGPNGSAVGTGSGGSAATTGSTGVTQGAGGGNAQTSSGNSSGGGMESSTATGMDVCGDGVCSNAESCSSCADDCGACTEPGACAGFATTMGGEGQRVVAVTNLDDSGPGSLREALSAGYRTVTFDVAGEIQLQSEIAVVGAFVTIDGFSAPSPGITLKNWGLNIEGRNGVHDLIVRGIRIRDAGDDGFRCWQEGYNIVVDHCSFAGSADGNLDLTDRCHDVTVCWTIVGETVAPSAGASLINLTERVSMHHNLYFGAEGRSPSVGHWNYDGTYNQPTETSVDLRNNVIFWVADHATWSKWGALINVVNNYYSAPTADPFKQTYRAITIDASNGGRGYVAGNVSGDAVGEDINVASVPSPEPAPFDAPFVSDDDACTSALQVRAQAGVMPRDSVDQNYVDNVVLNNCP